MLDGTMRLLTLLQVAFGLLVSASLHIDISSDGDVAIELDTDQVKHPHQGLPKQSKIHNPVFLNHKKLHVLKADEIDLGYEVHAGFPSVCPIIARRLIIIL